MKQIFTVATLLLGMAGFPVLAQVAVPPAVAGYQAMAAPQMDQLLGPIALYPDPLIAEMLPAATLPTQIVLADRYIIGGGDTNSFDQQPWDASVQALARYPSVLKWMDDNLNWTTELGQAFLNQQKDVMDSIQRLRGAAQKFGNLQSTPQQQVVADGGDIEILPADPEVIYVPVYSPDQIYYQSGFGLSFGFGWPMGDWLGYDFDWNGGYLMEWNHGYRRPANWWHESRGQRNAAFGSHASAWRPQNHANAGMLNRGDRGWNNSVVRSSAPFINRTEQPSRAFSTRNGSINNAARSAPVQMQRAIPVNRPVSNGAFIGVQSSQQTKSFSNRGQQSMQTMTRSAPVPVSRPAPSSGGGFHGGGGGGGSHGGNRH